MAFLRNAWYAAAWAEELTAKPLSRTLLDDPIVMYRGRSGEPIALADRCPHRFAPLSLGKVDGDEIRCPYHGLTFGAAGACVRNPHGRGATPPVLSVRPYPCKIQDGMIWIWMGSEAQAQGTAPPNYSFLGDPEWSVLRGYLHVNAHYELVTDNLLDLSHAEFLHPFIAPPGTASAIRFRAAQNGERVTAFHSMPDQPNTPLMSMLFESPPERIDGRAHMHWEPPCNMYLDVGATAVGEPEAKGVGLPQVHLLTPETGSSTHYFWAAASKRARSNEQLAAMLRAGLDGAFRTEDEPMIRAVQTRMGGRPLFELAPALLPMDEAAVRARRVLERRILDEQRAADASR